LNKTACGGGFFIPLKSENRWNILKKTIS